MGNTTRATTPFDGEDGEITNMPSAGGTVRDTDYQTKSGAEIISKGNRKTVHSAADLRDDDIVTVEGMQLKASQAREMGLMGRVFTDESLSVGAAGQAAHRATQESTQGPLSNPEGESGGEANVFQDAVDEGFMTASEAQVYDTTMAQLELAGLSADEAAETLSSLAEGAVAALDVEGDTRSLLSSVETEVTKASTEAALGEIGTDGFEYLQQAAATSPAINEAIRGYAVMRASGKAEGITWTDFLADVKEHLQA